ncbi:hypothetical protein [Phytohabitans kaempferiae]|uniref:Uncharacterized protein n=1 Tax=Phytohabitans kaempferiae TaxID=1620943 RepID=A0ABV6M5T1_9ACTN
MPRRRALMAALLTLAATVVAAVGAPPAAQAAITCDTASSNATTWYDGPSAGYTYDPPFYPSHYLTWTHTHTPQGAATWSNWDGSGTALILVTSYRDGAEAYIQAINASTGANLPGLRIAEFHAGGIAVVGSWVYISAGTTIRRYRTADLRTALQNGGGYVASAGSQTVTAASFLGTYGGAVFAGEFDPDVRGWMYQYTVNSDGSLTRVGSGWEVPTKTQGVIVTGSHFLFSTSYGRQNRSNIYSVRRGYTGSLDNASLYCFRAPSMSEGMTQWNGSAYVVYESGSHLYSPDPTTRNVIRNMHRVSMSFLTSLV